MIPLSFGARKIAATLSLLSAGLAHSGSCQQTFARTGLDSLNGVWVGIANLPDLGYFELRFDPKDSAQRASLDLPLKDRWDIPVRIEDLGGRLLLSSPIQKTDSARFEAIANAGKLTGTVRSRGVTAEFEASRILRNVASADALSANYIVGSHELLSIGSTDAGNAFFFDSRTNRVGRLEQQSDSIWTVGPGIGLAFPAVAVIYVERDSKSRILGLQWREGSSVLTARRRLDNTAIPLHFKNGEISLAGELLLPKSTGRHPAVVLLHGAGAQSRRDFHWLRYYLAGKGVAVFSYDKRGVGESGGNWRTASFEDLAADALAAVRLIRTRPDIDSLRVGVLGWSNGGWVAPLVTVHGEIAFAAVGAAPGTASGENIAFEVEKDLEDAGLGKTEVNAGVAARQYVTRFVINHPAITSAAWDSLKSMVARERDKTWFSRARIGWVLNVAPPPDSATISLLHGMAQQWTLDPVSGWSSIHVPVFIMLGANDNAVPAQQSAERLVSAFRRAGNCMATVKLYPGGSHALFRVNSLSQADVLVATHYVRGFPADLTGWLQARTRRTRAC